MLCTLVCLLVTYKLQWLRVYLVPVQCKSCWRFNNNNTYAESHLQDTACRPGAAADKAAANKSSKYCDLAGTHLFFPVVIETAGTWNQMAVELVQEIGRRITLVTEDSRETVFLFQRLSIALQRGNAVSFLSTFTATD